MVEDDLHHRLPPNQSSSMVVIHDNKDSFVFPPINHENLHIFSDSPSPSSSSSSSSSSSAFCSFSTSDSDTWGLSSSSSPFDSRVRKGGYFIRWLSIGFQILRSKLSSFRNHAANRGAIWSFGFPAAAFVMSFWLIFALMRKNKRKSLTPNESRLMNIIKEKDGRIAQLLHQIAQMNEILIARHKALAAKVVE